MFKIIKKYIMAIISRVSKRTDDFKINEKDNEGDVLFDLNAKEIEFILQVLGESNMQIKQIEFIYHLIIKLQKNYTLLNKK
jgi:hypothetical protein